MTKLCNGQAMESIHARDAERATCMTFCRDTITRLADKHHLHRAQIETLLTDRVRDKIIHCCYLLTTGFFFWTVRKKLKVKKTQNSRKKLKTKPTAEKVGTLLKLFDVFL